MANRSDIPVLFLACANSYKEGRRLNYLVKERRRIAQIFALEEEKGHVQVIQEGNTSKDFFFDELRQRRYKNRIAIIHFAGHADGETLRFESEEGHEEAMDVDTLANFLRTIKGLHLVFLNGCGTQPIVKKLLQKGIPVVIATQTQVQDQQASRVAEEFYQGIAGGYSIEESFAQAKAIAKSEFKFHQLQESDISRAMFWDSKSTQTQPEGEFPWGLYTLEGQEDHLNWHLDIEEKPLVKEKPWYKRAEGVLGLLSLLVAVIFGILELNVLSKGKGATKPEPDKIINTDGPIEPPVTLSEQIEAITPQPTFFGEGREESYNVLLLPFNSLGSSVNEIEGYVRSRLRSISESRNLPLNINVREPGIKWDVESELINVLDARKIGNKFGADMVIWGEYFLSNSDSDEIKLAVPPKAQPTDSKSGNYLKLSRKDKRIESCLSILILIIETQLESSRRLRMPSITPGGMNRFNRKPMGKPSITWSRFKVPSFQYTCNSPIVSKR